MSPLRTYREGHGKTQQEMADGIGVSRGYYAHLESGANKKNPGLQVLLGAERFTGGELTVQALAAWFDSLAREVRVAGRSDDSAAEAA